MPDLNLSIEEANPVPYGAAPMLAFKLRIANAVPGEAIHTIVLRCQIQIEATRRRYSSKEQKKMIDLFGEPERWSRTLGSLLWTHASVVVLGFEGTTVAEVLVPCTLDFNVASTKYFEGLSDGDIPLRMLFSGTVFYRGEDDVLQVAPISWNQEAAFKLPQKVWREMMDSYYPNSVWLNLRKDVFERLYEYKMQHGIPSWEQLIESVLPVEERVAS